MTNKFTYLLLVVLLITFASEIKGQSIPATLIIDPSTQITDGQNYNFVARDKILLKPGVKYKPNSTGISFHAKIDENIILPTSYRGSSTSTTRTTLSTTLNVGTTAGIAGVNEMGQSEYNIPIHVPPGISEMIPSLSIKYTLNNRLGRLGIGWDIAGISTIKRQGNNLYFDNKTNDPEFNEHDNYSLDGQRLLKITNLTSNNTYACENENHLRITAVGGTAASPGYFMAKTIDGITYEYGKNNANCKSTNNQKVVEWYINKITDENDNYIEFVYNEHNGQIYLEKILYTGNTTAGILPFNEIQFFYDEKQDANSYYINGERFENNLILRKIKTKAEGETVKLYEFVYAYNQGTKLVEIIENNSENKPYNSTLINWGNEVLSLEQKNEDNKVISSKITPTYLTSWGDIDNDGKNDMLLFDASGTNVNTPYVAHISSRNSILSLSGIRLPQTAGLVVGSSATLFDFNGDGKSEIYLFTQNNNTFGIAGYQYENGGFVTVNNSLTQYTFTANPIKPGAKETFQLAPINFSGQVDNFDVAIVNTSVLENNNQVSFFYQRVLGVVDNSGQTNNHLNDFIADQNALIVNFYDVRKLYFTDLNSDGKTDILEVYSLVYGFNNSQNFTLLQRSYKESESKYEVTYLTNDMQADFLHDFHLGDYNGDGNFDILTLVDSKWSIYTGKGNSFETTPFEIPQLNLPSGVDKQDISFIDMNSDGYYDITYFTYFLISPTKSGENLNVLYSDGNNFLLYTIGLFERIKRYRCTQQNGQYIELLPMLRHQVLFDQNNDGNLDLFYLSDIDRFGTYWECDKTIFTYNLLKINNGLHNNKVVEIVNGMNESAKFTYQNNGALASNNSYKRTRNFNGNFGVLYKTKHLTTSLTKAIHHNNEVLKTTLFTYENGVYNTLGKGFLGYLNMTTTTEWPEQAANKKIVTKQLNANHAFLYTSQVINQTHNGTNFINISTINNVFSMASGLVSPKQYRQHLTSKIFYNNTNGISNVTNYSDFNPLGYPGKIEEFTGNGAKLKTTTFSYTQVNTNLGDNKVSKIITNVTGKPTSGSTTPYSGPTYYNSTEYTYYTNGSIKTKVDYSDQQNPITTTYEYYLSGLLHKKTISTPGKVDRKERWIYDNKQRFATMHYNYLNQLSQNTYEPKFGNVISSISIQGDFVSNEYNANGNLIKTTAPNGSITNYATQWEQHSLSTKVMYSDYAQNDDYTTIKKYYNLSGQLILSSNRNLSNTEVFEKFEYDTKGRVIKQTKPFLIDQQESEKKHILYTYDKLDRLRKTDDNGRITRTDYSFEFDVAANFNLLNPSQNQKIERLMLNEQTTQSYKLYTYNTDNELANITDNSTSISFLHHANGQLLSSTTAGVTTTYEYDYQGNRLLLIEPNAGSILSEYSPLGELTKQTDARGYVTEFFYNDFGQLTSKKVTPPTGIASTTNYQYITSGRARNNPSTITSTDVNQTFLYDGEGRLKTYTESIQGQNFTKHYTYDKLDNIIQVIYPSGFSEKREYTKGNLKRIRRGDNNHLIWEATNFNYLDMNTVNTFGNELKQYISYDDRFKIQSHVVKYQTQTPIYHHTYTFDNITGNLNQHKDIVHGLEETFVFDNTDRLTEASNNPTGSTPQVAMQVQYHPNGNIKKKTDVSSIDYSYASTPPHAVTGIADPNLSGTTSFNQVIQYNHANRPTQILYNTHQINFVYASDDERRKTEQLDNNQLVKTKYFFSNFEREINAAGITKDFHYIYANGNLVSVMVQTANTKDMYYTCTDYLDNINLVINQSKTVAQENSFDAWGRRRNVNTWSHTNVTNPTLLQRGYTGHEHLDDFGLINMNARLYDPLIGRMLSPDNVLFDVTNSQNYNKYTYVLNNPLRYTDPTGNVPQGGLSQALTPGGLSHAGFNAAYMEFRAQTAQEEKNQMLEQLLMDASGGGAISDGDPIIPRGQANQSWIGEIGFGSRLTPNSKANMRQTEAYLYIGNLGINQNKSRVKNTNPSGGWVATTNTWNGGFGVSAAALQNLSGRITIGSNFKFYSSGWGGNQYVSTAKIAKVGQLLGYGTLFIGTLLDGYGVTNYYRNGSNHPNSVHPGKAALNLGIGSWGLINPATATGAALYYGIDNFYPGGFNGAMQNNANLQMQNQQILGPRFNLYRDW